MTSPCSCFCARTHHEGRPVVRTPPVITGNDRIDGLGAPASSGGLGDTMTGGPGADIFQINIGESPLVRPTHVTDFEIEVDKLRIISSGVDGNSVKLVRVAKFSRAADSTAATLAGVIAAARDDVDKTAGLQPQGEGAAVLVRGDSTAAGAGGLWVLVDAIQARGVSEDNVGRCRQQGRVRADFGQSKSSTSPASAAPCRRWGPSPPANSSPPSETRSRRAGAAKAPRPVDPLLCVLYPPPPHAVALPFRGCDRAHPPLRVRNPPILFFLLVAHTQQACLPPVECWPVLPLVHNPEATPTRVRKCSYARRNCRPLSKLEGFGPVARSALTTQL